jgi:hypothetical protein
LSGENEKSGESCPGSLFFLLISEASILTRPAIISILGYKSNITQIFRIDIYDIVGGISGFRSAKKPKGGVEFHGTAPGSFILNRCHIQMSHPALF